MVSSQVPSHVSQMLQELPVQHKPRPKESRPEDQRTGRQLRMDRQRKAQDPPSRLSQMGGEKRGVSKDEGEDPAKATRSEDQNPSVP